MILRKNPNYTLFLLTHTVEENEVDDIIFFSNISKGITYTIFRDISKIEFMKYPPEAPTENIAVWKTYKIDPFRSLETRFHKYEDAINYCIDDWRNFYEQS